MPKMSNISPDCLGAKRILSLQGMMPGSGFGLFKVVDHRRSRLRGACDHYRDPIL